MKLHKLPEGKRWATKEDLRVGQVLFYLHEGEITARKVKRLVRNDNHTYLDTHGAPCHTNGAMVDDVVLRAGDQVENQYGIVGRVVETEAERDDEWPFNVVEKRNGQIWPNVDLHGKTYSCDHHWTIQDVGLPNYKAMTYGQFVDATTGASASEDPEKALMVAGLGVAGESGEIADIIKKHVTYGNELDRGKLVEEMGDAYNYLQFLANQIGVTLQDCRMSNREKLMVRYRDGYNPKDAVSRDKDAEQAVFDKFRTGRPMPPAEWVEALHSTKNLWPGFFRHG